MNSGTEKPTHRQIEAFKFVFIHDCSHRQAARLMGCTRSNVTRLLLRLKEIHPELFPKKRTFKTHSFDVDRDSAILIKF